jgi:CRP-like cAMP-binding protein
MPAERGAGGGGPLSVTPSELGDLPLFAGLAPATLAALAAAAHRRRYRRDMLLFAQGEPLEAFHVVLGGEVRAFRVTAGGQEQTLHLLRRGEVLPVVAYLPGLAYPASAQAVTDCEVAVVRSEVLARLVRTRADLAWAFLVALGRRLLWAQGRMHDLALRSAAGRVASALLQLAHERGQRQADGRLRLDRPFTHRELGQLAGLSRETVSRTLARLRGDGAVQRTEGGVLVDPGALARWLGSDGEGI